MSRPTIIDQAVRLARESVPRDEIARRLGTSPQGVSSALSDARRRGLDVPYLPNHCGPKLVTDEQIRELAESGLHCQAIARELGVDGSTVSRRAKRAGIVLPLVAPRPRRGQSNSRSGVPVPKWVPATLRAEYRDIGAMFGEEHAASVIRAMKRDEART